MIRSHVPGPFDPQSSSNEVQMNHNPPDTIGTNMDSCLIISSDEENELKYEIQFDPEALETMEITSIQSFENLLRMVEESMVQNPNWFFAANDDSFEVFKLSSDSRGKSKIYISVIVSKELCLSIFVDDEMIDLKSLGALLHCTFDTLNFLKLNQVLEFCDSSEFTEKIGSLKNDLKFDSLMKFFRGEANICRICFLEEAQVNQKQLKLTTGELNETFAFIAAQQFDPEPRLPQRICLDCSVILEKVRRYKETIIDSENILLDYFKVLPPPPPPPPVASPPLPSFSITELKEDPESPVKVSRRRRSKWKLYCEECNRHFMSRDQEKKHKASYHDPILLPCDHCDAKLNAFRLKEHKKRRHGIGAFVCDICHKGFPHKFEIVIHIRSVHLEENLYPCRQCDAKFRKAIYLRKHVQLKHPELREKDFLCPTCGVSFPTAKGVKVHSYSCSRPAIPAEPKFTEPLWTEKFPCPICPMAFNLKQMRDEHVQKHSKSKREFICEICNLSYVRKAILRYHMKITHFGGKDYKYTCSYCPKRFMHRQPFMEHENIHTGNRPYKCNMCSKTFANHSSLGSHKTTHSKDIYQCRFCPPNAPEALYNRVKRLIYHVRTKHPKEFDASIDFNEMLIFTATTLDDNDAMKEEDEENAM